MAKMLSHSSPFLLPLPPWGRGPPVRRRSRFCFLRSKVDAVGQFAEAIVAMLDPGIADDHDPQSRFVAPLRHADRTGSHGFDSALRSDGVTVIMPREEILHAEHTKQVEVSLSTFTRNVEVLVEFVSSFQEPGMMLE